MCANMLEASCFSVANDLAELKAEVESLGIRPVCLSGSGSAMFCVIEDRDEQKARIYKHRLQEEIGCNTIIVSNNRW
jgi:4-diphosphocytidyl-2C-methyl-D-erythritol kinase